MKNNVCSKVSTARYPVLTALVESICKKSPFQKKSLEKHLATCTDEFLCKAEGYLDRYFSFLRTKNIGLDLIVDAYIMMAKDILAEQTRFLTSNRYRFNNLQDVYCKVYSNKEYMSKYMIGVALSQFLWKNHRDMFLFFIEKIRAEKGEYYLEIGPGHGLYFMEAISAGSFNNYHAIDISDASLEITKDLVAHSVQDKNIRVAFYLNDITKHSSENKYDFITLGEVLEHVEKPRDLLRSIHGLLTKNGRAFISTCANAPVIDHIYLYNTIDEIRSDIVRTGFNIIIDIVICNDGTKEEDWVAKKANLSYACIVEKDGE